MYDDSANTPLSRMISGTAILDREQERRLVRRCSSGCSESRENLIISFMPLVRSIARQMVRGIETVDDLVAEGTRGLINAVDDVDPERTNRFSSYAKYDIAAAMQTHLMAMKSLVVIKDTPHNKRILFFSTRETKKAGFCTDETLTSGQARKVAEGLKVDPMRFEMMDVVIRGAAQVDIADVAGTDLTVVNPLLRYPDQESDASDAQIEARCSTAIASIVDHLDARETDILRNRLLTDEETLDVLSARYDVSRERIRQVEERLLQKMRFWIAQADPGLVEALLNGRDDPDVRADMDPRWQPASERDGRARMVRSAPVAEITRVPDRTVERRGRKRREPEVVEEPIGVFLRDGVWSMTTKHLE